jgi:hypothetical protein
MRLGLFAIDFGSCADPELQRRVAAAAGVDRLIVFAMVPAARLEATVREIGRARGSAPEGGR